ncbi:MAG: radical SAM protein [Desulfobacterales bacterium]|nr:radical SAM protein [Desulfobacterales bacterium]
MPQTVLLLQLPVPTHNVGARIGNIPLGPACLKLAAEAHVPEAIVTLFPQDLATYGGDALIIDAICKENPDILGLTLTCWNVERSLYIAEKVKEKTGCRVVAGGPEVTPDNPLVQNQTIDFRVFGEGEEIFVRLLTEPALWREKAASGCSETFFTQAENPYMKKVLTPGSEEIMLLETQRGCPYGCKFCYYNKARKGLNFLSDEKVLEGISWAVQNGVKELYLLDPSLNARPGLKELLKKIARINTEKKLSLRSEIRAEWIDAEAAELFAQAGFTVFEIGLQSTCRKAQELMGRKTDLKRFIAGVNHLKNHGILSTVDLIIGLPGDDLKSFSRSLGFVKENNLDDDMQVFPLSLLPGTAFRKEAKELGLSFQPHPPYTVLETPGFSKEEITLALDWAESLFEMDLMAPPEVDLSWKEKGLPKNRQISLGKSLCTAVLVLDSQTDIFKKKRFLTSPYQVVIPQDAMEILDTFKILESLVRENPFTPLEIIWVMPQKSPDANRIIKDLPLHRPHFMDLDLNLLEETPGNRAILTTLISESPCPDLPVPMTRTLRRFTLDNFPSQETLEALDEVDGVLIDAPDSPELQAFQKNLEETSEELLPLAFSDHAAMKRWREKTMGDRFVL